MTEIATNLETVFDGLFGRVVEEYKRLDNETRQGMFINCAYFEDLYRYWLIAPLYHADYKTIKFEQVYPSEAKGKGRRASCDIIAKSSKNTLWAELKFAFSDTGYTLDELTKDVIRLDNLHEGGIIRVYCIIIFSKDDSIPSWVNKIEEKSNVKATKIVRSERLPSFPEEKEWANSHLHVVVYYW